MLFLKNIVKYRNMIDEMINENLKLRQKLIEERNQLFEQKRKLDMDISVFNKEKETFYKIQDMKVEHLESELEFIKKHRMLPAECKFYSRLPKTPSIMKKLKKIKK